MYVPWLLFLNVMSDSWQETDSYSGGSPERSERKPTRSAGAQEDIYHLRPAGPGEDLLQQSTGEWGHCEGLWAGATRENGRNSLTSFSSHPPHPVSCQGFPMDEHSWEPADYPESTGPRGQPGRACTQTKTTSLGQGQVEGPQHGCCFSFPSPRQGVSFSKIGIGSLQGLFKTGTEKLSSGPVLLFQILCGFGDG